MTVYKVTYRTTDGTLRGEWADSERMANSICAAQNLLRADAIAAWMSIKVPTTNKRELVAWLNRVA